MRDPLGGFDWSSLDERYDALCSRFDAMAGQKLTPTPRSDRELYGRLVCSIHDSPSRRRSISIDLYEALLYWKLYSQPAAVANLGSWLDATRRSVEAEHLAKLVDDLPATFSRNEAEIVSLVKHLGVYDLAGMKTSGSLPVRSCHRPSLPSVARAGAGERRRWADDQSQLDG